MEVYTNQLKEYNTNKKGKENSLPKPAKPPEKILVIPANNSTTGVFQLLSANEGRELIFETKDDTLAQALKPIKEVIAMASAKHFITKQYLITGAPTVNR